MKYLEELYDIATKFLETDPPNWAGFATGFEDNLDAKMALYRPGIATEVFDLLDASEIIATNNLDMIKQYFTDKIYENSDLIKDPEIPFEPVRRSDSLTDIDLKKLPFYETFLRPHGIFHIIVIYAVLADGSFLVLFVWRDNTQQDFSQIEKLRLALFMRFLARIVSDKEIEASKTPSDVVKQFGHTYMLTPAETDILAALLDGFSLRAIAERTNRTYGTVRWHVRNLLNKCNVTSQKDLLHALYGLIER